mgnify:CR=1 FL=1
MMNLSCGLMSPAQAERGRQQQQQWLGAVRCPRLRPPWVWALVPAEFSKGYPVLLQLYGCRCMISMGDLAELLSYCLDVSISRWQGC